MGAIAEKTTFPKSRPAGPGKSVIQPALKVGKPNDKYEQEADAAADQVMMMPSTPATPVMSATSGGIQMKALEEEAVQMSPLSEGNSMASMSEQGDDIELDSNKEVQIPSDDISVQSKRQTTSRSSTLQFKLSVGKADDKYEQEADRMADSIVENSATPDIQNKCEDCDARKDQQRGHLADSITPFVQRKEILDGENISFEAAGIQPVMSNQIQRREVDKEEEVSVQAKSTFERPIPQASMSSVETILNSGNGLGYGLSEFIRKDMEAGYGVDLSKVRIHTDETAVRMNEILGAQAFTYGWDVFFNSNKYRPNTTDGKFLLAHELAHTLQQARSKGELLKPAETRIEQEMHPGANEQEALLEMQERAEDKAAQIHEEQATEATSTKETEKSGDKNGIAKPLQRKEPVLPICKPKGQKPRSNTTESPSTAPTNLTSGTPAPTSPAAPQPESQVAAQAPKCPAEDPAFRMAKTQVSKDAKKQRSHELPEQKRDEAMTASALSTEEQSLQSGQDQQAANLEAAAQPKPFNRYEFKSRLKEKIESKMPNTEEEAKKFAGSGKLEEAKQEFKETISTEKGKVTGTLEVVQQQELPEGQNLKPDNIEVPEAKPADAPSQLPTGQAAPKPRTDEEISLDHKSKELDQQMVQEGLSEKQLEESEEPQFEKALQTKRDAQREIAAAPVRYRQVEEQRLEKSQKRADQVSGYGLGEMSEIKTSKTDEVFGGQKTKETAVETRQRQIKEGIDGIYLKTEGDVQLILEELSTTVETTFSDAVEDANETFKSRVRSRLDDHYGWFTFDDKIAEWAGLSNGVAHIFREEKERFLAEMDTVLDNIAGTVELELNRALERIKLGRTELEELKATLSEEELGFAGEMFSEALTKFSELETSVNESQDELIETLSDAYVESVNKLQEDFDKINEELSASWIVDAFSFIGDVASAIKKLGQLLGSIASRIGEYVSDILSSPKRFFNNLVAGIKGGMDEFSANIDTYLEQGFWMWLTGASSAINIQIPKKMDAEGMFDLATQILGITKEFLFERIKQKLHVSIDEFLALAEKAEAVGGKILEPVKILINDGIGALWEWVKTEVSSHLESIFKKIKEEIFQAIIRKFLLWVAQLFIPGLGFIKLIQAAYKALKWLVDNIDRIAEIVNSFLDAIGLAVQGNVSAIKENVIRALTNGVVIAIDFLAKLVGLGNFADKLQRGIEMIRKPIYRVIDLILIKARPIVRKVQKAVAKIKGKVQGKVEAGKQKVGQAANKVLGWLGLRKKFQTYDGHSHQMYFEGTGANARLIIASTPINYLNWVAELEANPQIGATIIAPLRSKAQEIETEKARGVSPDQEDTKNSRIAQLFTELVTLTQNAAIPASANNTPTLYGPMVGGFGTHAQVASLAPSRTGGSEANSSLFNTNYSILNDRKQGARAFYVRGHLLSWHIGGPGNDWQNLTPLFQNANGDHERGFESHVKDHIESGKNVSNFSVEAIYGRSISPWVAKIQDPNDDDWPTGLDSSENLDKIGAILQAEVSVPTRLSCFAELVNTDGSTRSVPAPIANDISYPTSISSSFADYKTGASPKTAFNLTTTVNSAADDAAAIRSLKSLNGVGDTIAGYIVERIKNNQRITNYYDQIGISKKTLERRNPGLRITQ
ncbi:eCIS core domain-containing protein [Dyadobacter fanqingshengii]|uniref:DUF4157 domain-containing protein n=1 Tax=Dyadobacter fanqingshengii TaxID=2906443 RepID=A0A9X1T9B9_9BACT|nr:DUF4157 domain-containing protein [Dyadobacter fanqingshengii]MCF0039784.1 DUF4157 domain-containing protein [Dyadobacter fanqingshengii]USJ38453.1 DUF4157 domain-containing protein [Dyadobacter fanqingshengii]